MIKIISLFLLCNLSSQSKQLIPFEKSINNFIADLGYKIDYQKGGSDLYIIDVRSMTEPNLYLCRVQLEEKFDKVYLTIQNSPSKPFEKKFLIPIDLLDMNHQVFSELMKR